MPTSSTDIHTEDTSLQGPDRATFNQWLSIHFIANNRTKTISADKYQRICRFILGKDNFNAKFRFWVKSKGFYLLEPRDFVLAFYRGIDGRELYIKHEKKKNMNAERENKICERKMTSLFPDSKQQSLYRRVAAVEDFYDIIRNVHVDKYGSHAGQKQTYRIISNIFAFLPREVVTQYLINCEFCKPRIEKYGNMTSKLRRSLQIETRFDYSSQSERSELSSDQLERTALSPDELEVDVSNSDHPKSTGSSPDQPKKNGLSLDQCRTVSSADKPKGSELLLDQPKENGSSLGQPITTRLDHLKRNGSSSEQPKENGSSLNHVKENGSSFEQPKETGSNSKQPKKNCSSLDQPMTTGLDHLERNGSSFKENGFIELDEEDLYDDDDDVFRIKNEEIVESLNEEANNDTEMKDAANLSSPGVSIPPSPVTSNHDGNEINPPINKGPTKQTMKKERIKPSGSGRRLSYSTETDEKLLNWVKTLQESNWSVTREMLQKQALSLIQHECPEFKASSGWVEKFLVRHRISLPGMCRNFSSSSSDKSEKDAKRNGEMTTERVDFPREPVIREPPNLNELLNNVHSNSPSTKDEDEDNDDDEEDDADENEAVSGKSQSSDINPERLKAFNMFVRLFVDENLDRLVPISKQPKEKINAIILSCQRQFPEFSERARKRIRTYLKSCRRSSRLKEPLKRTAENMTAGTSHIPSTQLAEVNNILSQACYNETREVSKRARFEAEAVVDGNQTKQDKHPMLHLTQNNPAHAHVHSHERHVQKYMPFAAASRTPPVKLSTNEISAVRQLINGYRESAAFLYRSADELENLLKQSESYYGQQQQQQPPEQQQQHK